MKNISIFLTVLFFLSALSSICQITIPLKPQGGVFEIPCKINGKDSQFIFDTGAATVTISESYFLEGINNGYFLLSDKLPSIINFQIANGDVIEGAMVNIRAVDIGGIVLRNVLASVIKSQSNDMLLGQTLMQRFGSYTIDNTTNTLVINSEPTSTSNILNDYYNKGKSMGLDEDQTKKMFEPYIQTANQAISICQNMSFDFYKIILKNKESSEYSFEYDIRNGSQNNFNSGTGQIYLNLEIICTDGTIYSTTEILSDVLLGGRTIEGPKMSVKIRNKTPKYIRAYCSYFDLTTQKFY